MHREEVEKREGKKGWVWVVERKKRKRQVVGIRLGKREK
jgi:hypothetical protein